jgi:flagellar motor switch protein FliN/FliY
MADENQPPAPNPDAPAPGEKPPAGPGADVLAEAALAAAKEAIAGLGDLSDLQSPAPAATPTPAAAAPLPLPAFSPAAGSASAKGLEILSDVNLNVKIELGRTRMLVEDVLKLADGAVVELDKLAGDPVDVYVNDRHVARGEVLVLNDNFCVRISEIIAPIVEPAKK